MSSKNYYKYLNVLRLFSCIGVLFFHLNILKGGYLAVCVFFVLTGYLSFISACKKESFSLKSYYISKFKKIYIPLLCIVFLTISVLKIISSNLWLNLKPETLSVIFGYNNFWQIAANTDYFARHIDSPFIHFWYTGILLQFDLIFPFIYLFFNKIKKKIGKIIPFILMFIITIIFTIHFFVISVNTDNIMVVYYNTFCRCFSLLFGILLGMIHCYYKPLISNKIGLFFKKIIIYLYLIILLVLFVFIDSSSNIFNISMFLSSLITCRLIDYCTSINDDKENFLDKLINSVSNISYEIYLLQYPVIYIFQDININYYIKTLIIILIIVILSYLLKFSLNIRKNVSYKKLRIISLSIIILLSLYGLYNFIIAKDYTKDIQALKSQLENNKEIFNDKQKEFELLFKENEEKLNLSIDEIDQKINTLQDDIKNMPIIGIGDSIMLGAIDSLYNQFPNGYFDAQISRTAWVASSSLNYLKNKNILGNPIVFNLGANGNCPDEVYREILNIVENRDVFWVNVTNDKSVGVNSKLVSLSKKYDNFYVVDWNMISHNHPEYFVYDGIHLTNDGEKAYVKAIYDTIFNVYLDKLEKQKEEIINQYNDNIKNKITFYGDNILLNLFNNLQTDYSDNKYIIKDKITYNVLKNDIYSYIQSDILTNKMVFIFNKNFKLNNHELNEIIDLFGDKKLYFVALNNDLSNTLSNINNSNIKIIKFNEFINNNKDYLAIDGINLSDLGINTLINLLNNELNSK